MSKENKPWELLKTTHPRVVYGTENWDELAQLWLGSPADAPGVITDPVRLLIRAAQVEREQLTTERNDLQAEVERLRANSDGWEHLSDQNNELWCAAEKRNEALRTLIGELVDACDWHESGNFCQSHNDGPCNCDHNAKLIARARGVLGTK